MLNYKTKSKLNQIWSYTFVVVFLIIISFIISSYINISFLEDNQIGLNQSHQLGSGNNSGISKVILESYFAEQKTNIIRNHIIFGVLGVGLTFLFSYLIRREVHSFYESEKKYESLIDSSPFPIVIYSNSKIVFANFAALKLMEVPSFEIISGKNIFDFIHSDSMDIVKERIKKLSSSDDELETITEKFLTFRGAPIYVDVKSKNVTFNGHPSTMAIFNNVTEKKIWIDKIRASEANLKSLLNNNRISFVLFDTNRSLIYYNSKAVELFEKLSKKELKGEDALTYYFQKAVSAEFLNCFNIALSGNDCTYEKAFTTKSGQEILLQNDVHPVKTDRGEITGVVLASTDITELINSQISLKESRERLKTIYTNTNIGIVLTDSDGYIEYSNPAFSKILKYSEKEVIDKKIGDLSHPDDYKVELELIKQMKKGLKETISLEKRYITKNKDSVWARINITCSRNDDNSIKYLTGIVEDITERKQTEFELKKINMMKDILSNSIMNSPLGMILWEVENSNTKIIDWNNASYNIFGWSKEEVLSKNFFDLITILPELKGNSNGSKIQKNENYPSCYLTESTKKNGDKIVIYLHNTAMFDADTDVIRIMSLVQDVTEQKQIEKELIVAKEEAEKADKLKSEFLAQMSHEIRTPINAMLSFTSLIKEDVKGFNIPDIDQSFEIIKSAGNRIIRTTDLLINMAEIQTNTHDFNPNLINIKDDILANLFSSFKPFAKQKKLDLNFNYKAQKMKVIADEYMLRKVFDNLIDNAIKFTNQGKVEVEVTNNNSKLLCVAVKDTGIGISQKYLDNLFRPFSQEESGYTRKFEGNGLGLALVKKYCDMNNANIKVESEKGVGTTFSIELELA